MNEEFDRALHAVCDGKVAVGDTGEDVRIGEHENGWYSISTGVVFSQTLPTRLLKLTPYKQGR